MLFCPKLVPQLTQQRIADEVANRRVELQIGAAALGGLGLGTGSGAGLTLDELNARLAEYQRTLVERYRDYRPEPCGNDPFVPVTVADNTKLTGLRIEFHDGQLALKAWFSYSVTCVDATGYVVVYIGVTIVDGKLETRILGQDDDIDIDISFWCELLAVVTLGIFGFALVFAAEIASSILESNLDLPVDLKSVSPPTPNLPQVAHDFQLTYSRAAVSPEGLSLFAIVPPADLPFEWPGIRVQRNVTEVAAEVGGQGDV